MKDISSVEAFYTLCCAEKRAKDSNVQFCWWKRDGSKGTLIGIHLEKLYQRLKCLRISMAPSRDVRIVGGSGGNTGGANYPAGKIPWRMPANGESQRWRTFIRWRFHNFSTGLLIGFFFFLLACVLSPLPLSFFLFYLASYARFTPIAVYFISNLLCCFNCRFMILLFAHWKCLSRLTTMENAVGNEA